MTQQGENVSVFKKNFYHFIYIKIYIALFTLILKLRQFRDLLMSPGIEFHNPAPL